MAGTMTAVTPPLSPWSWDKPIAQMGKRMLLKDKVAQPESLEVSSMLPTSYLGKQLLPMKVKPTCSWPPCS